MVIFLAGWFGIITAIATGTLVLFIAATIVAGASQGIAISAATRGLLHGSTLADRAPIFSAIYLLCYSGAAIPALISGQLSNTFSLPQIAFAYGALALIATLFTVLAARNPRADTADRTTPARARRRSSLTSTVSSDARWISVGPGRARLDSGCPEPLGCRLGRGAKGAGQGLRGRDASVLALA